VGAPAAALCILVLLCYLNLWRAFWRVCTGSRTARAGALVLRARDSCRRDGPGTAASGLVASFPVRQGGLRWA
jgi:hypothetical protein